MRVTSIGKDKTSFGWGHSTHKCMDKRVCQKYENEFENGANIKAGVLIERCVDPDKFIKKQGHFANIDCLQEKPRDAYYWAQHYTTQAIIEHRKCNYGERNKYIAYALHFIQDSVDPMHVVFNELASDSPERLFHTAFENMAAGMEKDVLEHGAFADVAQCDFFATTLPKAMRTTKQRFERMTKGKSYEQLLADLNANDKKIRQIAAKSLNTGLNMTNAYLYKLVEVLKAVDKGVKVTMLR